MMKYKLQHLTRSSAAQNPTKKLLQVTLKLFSDLKFNIAIDEKATEVRHEADPVTVTAMK